MNIGIMFITDGRRHCAERTLASLGEIVDLEHVTFAGAVNDCPDPSYGDWLSGAWGFDRVLPPQRHRRGFGGAIQAGWEMMDESCVDYVFHLEDDFIFQRWVPLTQMAKVLDDNPHLCQMALKRQPWNPQEHEAGGLVELNAASYIQCWDEDDHEWFEHDLFFTTNPSLYPSALMELGWPDGELSEGRFTQKVRAAGYRFAYWGRKYDTPWVFHIGEDRTGTGY